LRETLGIKSAKIASPETTSVMDWQQDVGMGVNKLKTEATYFSKKTKLELKFNWPPLKFKFVFL
jgi:hypothetical protein